MWSSDAASRRTANLIALLNGGTSAGTVIDEPPSHSYSLRRTLHVDALASEKF